MPESFGVLFVIGLIVAMILIYACIMPENKYKSLSPFAKWLSDTFNFRTLWLESILKFFYVLTTTACVIFGVLLFFFLLTEDSGAAFSALLFLILGPVIIRLIYEGSMMLVLLVKNVMQINKRLMGKTVEDKYEPATAPMREPVKEPVMSSAPIRPSNSPSQNSRRVCSNCGTAVEGLDAAFCPNCGTRV